MKIKTQQNIHPKLNKQTHTFSKLSNLNSAKYPSLNNPPNHSMPLHQRMNLFCNFCKRPGHQDSQCYSKAKNFQRGPPTDRPPNRVNRTQVENSCTNEHFLLQTKFEDNEFFLCERPDKSLSEEEKLNLLQEAHGNVATGHFGENKTIRRLREQASWENMEGDAIEFIKRCKTCQHEKLP